MSFYRSLLVTTVVAMVSLTVSLAMAGTVNGQVRIARDTGARDLGVAPASEVKSVTFALKLPDQPALEAFIASTTDRDSPNFRKFLTPDQFARSYGQSDAAVAQVVAYLKANGLIVTKVYGNHLLISAKATNAQLTALFGAPIHQFSIRGQTYQRPVVAVGVPAALQDVVSSVAGLSTQAIFKPHHLRLPPAIAQTGGLMATHGAVTKPSATSVNAPGKYTVVDLARQYNVKPLYVRGRTGAGKTLAILTFANFDQTDAYAYWAALGLNVSPTRITEVLVDGGTGDDGAEETTLDVQQAGGIAPGAKIRVYEAPNTDAGAIDLYAQAVEENLADTMSTSWGLFEIADDPGTLDATSAIFLQAAAQGIVLSASAGDAGAFDINRSYAVYPGCTTLLTVDFPASSPFVLAAGGTTLPGVIPLELGSVTVPAERPWGWDYLRPYLVRNFGQANYYATAFPSGGGGGVSVQFGVPSYQAGLQGVKASAAGQSLFCSDFLSDGSMNDLADLPVGFAGRNLPDVSLNADPLTGYSIFFQGEWVTDIGGTSFVAPQLNGIFALIAEDLGGRIGFANPQLYGLLRKHGYSAASPFRPITSGSNLFYTASRTPSYNPASGIGTLDVDNLAKALK